MSELAKLEAAKLAIIALRGKYGRLTRLQCIVIVMIELHFGDEARAVTAATREQAVVEFTRIAKMALEAAMEE